VKQWQETGEILERVAQLEAAGQGAALATVVRISGSAYRRPGAKFLIAEEGSTLGGVSGGCLEEDVRQNGLQIIGGGDCRLLHYETGDDDDALWGLGLGCNGAVDIFVQPTTTAAFQESAGRIRALLAGDAPFAVATLLDDRGGDGLAGRGMVAMPGGVESGSSGDAELDAALMAAATASLAEKTSEVMEIAGSRAFIETYLPPPVLALCGAGDDAIPLAQLAAGAGFRVAVIDHRPAYLTAARFPAAWQLLHASPDDQIARLPTGNDTYVVLKTHNLVRDKAWARRFLAWPVAYVGLLGPRARCEEIAADATEHDRRRIYGPVGVDLGAEGPEQVGLAVVAELLAVRAGRRPGHLKDRKAPIHD
jgi:xanthine/CO dehydrogenase XdhC/CoxF family maturation factor